MRDQRWRGQRYVRSAPRQRLRTRQRDGYLSKVIGPIDVPLKIARQHFGRQQSKNRVLRTYVRLYTHKIGARAKSERTNRPTFEGEKEQVQLKSLILDTLSKQYLRITEVLPEPGKMGLNSNAKVSAGPCRRGWLWNVPPLSDQDNSSANNYHPLRPAESGVHPDPIGTRNGNYA